MNLKSHVLLYMMFQNFITCHKSLQVSTNSVTNHQTSLKYKRSMCWCIIITLGTEHSFFSLKASFPESKFQIVIGNNWILLKFWNKYVLYCLDEKCHASQGIAMSFYDSLLVPCLKNLLPFFFKTTSLFFRCQVSSN